MATVKNASYDPSPDYRSLTLRLDTSRLQAVTGHTLLAVTREDGTAILEFTGPNYGEPVFDLTVNPAVALDPAIMDALQARIRRTIFLSLLV